MAYPSGSNNRLPEIPNLTDYASAGPAQFLTDYDISVGCGSEGWQPILT